MAKFSAVLKGTLARESVKCTTVHGAEFACDVRAFNGVDDAAVLEQARAFAIEHGVDAPKDGDPLYEQGKWVHTILRACVDPDSPAAAPVAYFDGGAKDILDNFDRDRMAYLVERQAKLQDSISLGPKTMSPAECIAAAIQMAGSQETDELPFERWRWSMQRAYLRFTADLLLISLGTKLPPTSPSSGISRNSSTSPRSPADAPSTPDAPAVAPGAEDAPEGNVVA